VFAGALTRRWTGKVRFASWTLKLRPLIVQRPV
jgi:hypothetical protein